MTEGVHGVYIVGGINVNGEIFRSWGDRWK